MEFLRGQGDTTRMTSMDMSVCSWKHKGVNALLNRTIEALVPVLLT